MNIRPSDELETTANTEDTKQETAEPPKPEMKPTIIWRCKDNSCKAWVREEYAETEYPQCPLCKGPTIRSYKHLPVMIKKKTRKPKSSGVKKS